MSMQSFAYDVTLYWHDGGSIFLGTVRAVNHDEAENKAIARYMNCSKKQAEEVGSGGYGLIAKLISGAPA